MAQNHSILSPSLTSSSEDLIRMRSLPMTLLRFLFVLTVLPELSLAVIQNRTIDDTRGDSVTANQVIYQGLWNANTCLQCLIEPDPAQAFDGTWKATTYFQQSQDPVNATITFTGTAIYVFFILANNAGTGVVSKTKANITLDNQSPELYEHDPDISSTDLQYNALVFSQSNLENVHHSLVISVSGIQEEVYVNFDYAIYTHEDQVFGASASGEPVSDPTEPTQVPNSSGGPGPSPISFSSIASALGTLGVPLGAQRQSSVPSVPTSQSTPLVSALSISNPASGSSTFSIPPSPIPTDVGTPTEPSQSSSAQTVSQHAKVNIPIGLIVGGSLGGLVILSFLIFGITFIRRKRSQRLSDSRTSSVDLLDSEDGSGGSRVYVGNGNIDENGTDTSIVPFHLGPPFPAQYVGVKPSEVTAITSRQETPSATVTPRTTRVLSANEVTRPNSGHSMAGLRRARQQELDQRLQSMQQEMVEILDEINNRRASQQISRPLPIPGHPSQSFATRTHDSGGSADAQMPGSVDELQHTLRHMRQQIEHLQQQQQSAWAQGLSNDPPPGYTTDTRV